MITNAPLGTLLGLLPAVMLGFGALVCAVVAATRPRTRHSLYRWLTLLATAGAFAASLVELMAMRPSTTGVGLVTYSGGLIVDRFHVFGTVLVLLVLVLTVLGSRGIHATRPGAGGRVLRAAAGECGRGGHAPRPARDDCVHGRLRRAGRQPRAPHRHDQDIGPDRGGRVRAGDHRWRGAGDGGVRDDAPVRRLRDHRPLRALRRGARPWRSAGWSPRRGRDRAGGGRAARGRRPRHRCRPGCGTRRRRRRVPSPATARRSER